MTLTGLGAIVANLQQQPGWRLQHQFLQVLEAWPAVVGSALVHHSRPIAIRRQVLEVATAGGVWSQALTFERSRILVKLNTHLREPLKDIRFSTARWRVQPPSGAALPGKKRVPPPLPPPPPSPLEAFRRWEHLRRQQTGSARKCPRCQRPVPQSDLERWGCCAFCIRADWA